MRKSEANNWNRILIVTTLRGQPISGHSVDMPAFPLRPRDGTGSTAMEICAEFESNGYQARH
jgi:hypothetical protein